MTTIKTVCGNYGVDLIRNGDNENSIIAMAYMPGSFEGETEYWFTIGHYKSEKTAIRQAVKKMAKFGKELAI